jgi:hypothetical protein
MSTNFLKKYYLGHFTGFLSSQFIFSSLESLPRLKSISYSIRGGKSNSTAFLYLFGLANKIPYLSFQHKTIVHKARFKLVNKSRQIKLNTLLTHTRLFPALSTFLFSIIPIELPTQNKRFKVLPRGIKLILENPPLMWKTYKLQSLQQYIHLLPLTVFFSFKKATLFQKFYILRFLKILKKQSIPSFV